MRVKLTRDIGVYFEQDEYDKCFVKDSQGTLFSKVDNETGAYILMDGYNDGPLYFHKSDYEEIEE